MLLEFCGLNCNEKIVLQSNPILSLFLASLVFPSENQHVPKPIIFIYFLLCVVVVVSFSMECFSCVTSKGQISLFKLPEHSVFLFLSFSGVIGQSPVV